MPELGHRAATAADLDIIHRELMAVIDESPYYNDTFKAHEKGRLTLQSMKKPPNPFGGLFYSAPPITVSHFSRFRHDGGDAN